MQLRSEDLADMTEAELLKAELEACNQEFLQYPEYLALNNKIKEIKNNIEAIEVKWMQIYSDYREKNGKTKTGKENHFYEDIPLQEIISLQKIIDEEHAALAKLRSNKKAMVEANIDLFNLIEHTKFLKQKIAIADKEALEKDQRDKRNQAAERWDIAKKAEPMVTKPISLASAIGKIGGVVSSIFMDLSKGIVSPVDYFLKGCFAIRDFVTTETTAGQRKVKLGSALLVAAASFAYVGISIALASHLLLGATISTAAVAAIPIAGPVLLAAIAGIGLVKEAYVFHNMRMQIKTEENRIASLRKKYATLTDQVKKDRIRIQIQRHENYLQGMIRNRNYQRRRVTTSIITTVGYIVAACGLLFPPLFVAGAALVVTGASIDAYDKHQQRKNLAEQARAAAQRREQRKTVSMLAQKKLADSTAPHAHEGLHVSQIQVDLAAHTTRAVHNAKSIKIATEFTKHELDHSNETHPTDPVPEKEQHIEQPKIETSSETNTDKKRDDFEPHLGH